MTGVEHRTEALLARAATALNAAHVDRLHRILELPSVPDLSDAWVAEEARHEALVRDLELQRQQVGEVMAGLVEALRAIRREASQPGGDLDTIYDIASEALGVSPDAPVTLPVGRMRGLEREVTDATSELQALTLSLSRAGWNVSATITRSSAELMRRLVEELRAGPDGTPALPPASATRAPGWVPPATRPAPGLALTHDLREWAREAELRVLELEE